MQVFGVMGDVERLPALGALPLTRHLFPIPLEITYSLLAPKILSSLSG